MTPAAQRCFTVAQTICEALADRQDWKVVIHESEAVILVEIMVDGPSKSAGQILGREGSHVEAIRMLMIAAARGEKRTAVHVGVG